MDEKAKVRAIRARFSSPDSIMIYENWKDANGVDAKADTNSALAKRNYDLKCEHGSSPLAVVEGYHIWWCKSHHQPMYKCEIERLKLELLTQLKITTNEKVSHRILYSW